VPHGYLSDNEGDAEVVVVKTEKEVKKPRVAKEEPISVIIGPFFMSGFGDISQISDDLRMMFLDDDLGYGYTPFSQETIMVNVPVTEKMVPERVITTERVINEKTTTPKKCAFPEESVEALWDVSCQKL